jgi:hypothetical protein
MQTLMNARAASSTTVLNMLSVLIYVAHIRAVARMGTQTSQRTHSFQEESAQVRYIKHN